MTLQRVTSLLKSPGTWCILVTAPEPCWLREQKALAGKRMSLEMCGRKLSGNLFSISSGDKAKLSEPIPQQRGVYIKHKLMAF